MSLHHLDWALKLDLPSPLHKLILFFLANRCDENGFAKCDGLVAFTCSDLDSVCAAVEELQATGLLIPGGEGYRLAAPAEPAAWGGGSQPRLNRPDEKVWVYVIAVDHPGEMLVKVGISKSPQYRRETLERERGLNLYVANTHGPFSRAGARAVEKSAHEVLAAHRESGEWFVCGAEAATDAVLQCVARAAV